MTRRTTRVRKYQKRDGTVVRAHTRKNNHARRRKKPLTQKEIDKMYRQAKKSGRKNVINKELKNMEEMMKEKAKKKPTIMPQEQAEIERLDKGRTFQNENAGVYEEHDANFMDWYEYERKKKRKGEK